MIIGITIFNFFLNAGCTGPAIDLVFLEAKLHFQVGRCRAEGIHHELQLRTFEIDDTDVDSML